LTHHVEANEAVAPIADLAADLNYQKRLPLIYIAMGTFRDWVEEDYSKGVRYLSEAIRISEGIKDNVSLWYASFFLGFNLSWNGEFENGLEYLRKSLDLGVSANNLIQISSAKSGISTFNYVFCGKNDLAYQISKEAVELAQEGGDNHIKGIA
jgi:hypothetical protein